MSALTTTKRAKRVLRVTASELGATATNEWRVLWSAMLIGGSKLPAGVVRHLIVGDEDHLRAPPISSALRQRTEREMDALASHNRRRRAAVLSRVLDDGRLAKLEGTGYVASIDARLSIEWVPTLEGYEMLVDYALALLMDDSQPWGARFFRCQLETCQQFFVSPPPKHQGQFRYKYCSPEHQKDADRSKVAERVRRHRERQKK